MFIKFLTFGFFLMLLSCSETPQVTQSESLISSTMGPQTFQAKYKGKGQLRVGDRLRILEYEDFVEDLKEKESRNMPLGNYEKRKKIIGHATVSTVLDDNYYEFKLDKPQPVPAEVFIEKL